MSRILTRELAQEEAQALVAAKAANAKQAAPPVAPASNPPPALPAQAPAEPIAGETGPGGDTRDSGQPSVLETLTAVADHMRSQEPSRTAQ